MEDRPVPDSGPPTALMPGSRARRPALAECRP